MKIYQRISVNGHMHKLSVFLLHGEGKLSPDSDVVIGLMSHFLFSLICLSDSQLIPLLLVIEIWSPLLLPSMVQSLLWQLQSFLFHTTCLGTLCVFLCMVDVDASLCTRKASCMRGWYCILLHYRHHLILSSTSILLTGHVTLWSVAAGFLLMSRYLLASSGSLPP
jgi:hypothetical protein